MQSRQAKQPRRQRRYPRQQSSQSSQSSQPLQRTLALLTFTHTLKARIIRLPQGARLALGAMALLLVAGMFVGFAGGNRAQIAAQRQGHVRHVATLRTTLKTPVALPNVGHWVDTADSTTYSVQFQVANQRLGNGFTFTLPTGEELVGNVFVFTLSDGTLAQEALDGRTSPTIVQPSCRQGILQSDTPQVIVYAFVAHISTDGVAAFATLSYANGSDKQGINSVCSGQAGAGVTTYQMSAGCTLTDCSDLASQTGPAVTAHDNAILAAEQSSSVSNWTVVYKLTARQVTAQYSPEQFASLLTRQEDSVGKITAISAPETTPTVQFTPEGQAYFAVQQTVTVQHDGSKSTQTLTSYYVLESGTWLFWFTQ